MVVYVYPYYAGHNIVTCNENLTRQEILPLLTMSTIIFPLYEVFYLVNDKVMRTYSCFSFILYVAQQKDWKLKLYSYLYFSADVNKLNRAH